MSLFGLHQNRLHLDAFKCRFRRLRQELHMRNERGWFALRIILTDWNEIDVARVKKPSDVLPGRRQAVFGRYGDQHRSAISQMRFAREHGGRVDHAVCQLRQ